MSFNKPEKHVVSADRLALIQLINLYIDQKTRTLKQTCVLG